jgi:hypothetical protein
MSENQNIIDFINIHFKASYNDLASEITKIFNNLTEEECYIPYFYNSLFIINGASDNVKGTLTFSYLIPNLFRKCFTEPSVHIPNICPTFIFNSRVTNYFPLLLEEKLIKSFLYFNFTGNYSILNKPEKLIYMLGAIDRLKIIKSNTTYGSFTKPYEIFNNLYSPDSLLVQLLQFNNYLKYATNAQNNQKTVANYIIPWNYVDYCICYTGYLDDTYVISNDNSTINETLAFNLNNIRYSSLDTKSTKNNINTNGIVTIATSNNIYVILDYVLEVYQDILMEIQYYMGNIKYCKKDYMLKSNIPYLLELYKNYYNNQIYVGNKSVPVSSIKDVVANTVSIEVYLKTFASVFLENQPYNGNIYTNYNSVIISDNDGFDLFWGSSSSTLDGYIYSYWYLNINDPSPVELTQLIGTSSYMSTSQLVTTFFIPDVYNKSGATSNSYKIYLKSGVLSSVDSTAYTYFFYNADNLITAKYYLFLDFPLKNDPNQGYGIILKYYTYIS